MSADQVMRHIHSFANFQIHRHAAQRIRLFRGKTVPEVARRLGISEKEATERYRKGLRRMEEDLGEWLKTSRRPE